MFAACAESATLPATAPSPNDNTLAIRQTTGTDADLLTIKRVTAPYRDINAAIADGFVLLHGCEERGEERPVGAVYVHMGRLVDGRIDPSLPDALIYEPLANGKLTLVGAEFAIPYSLWTRDKAPVFDGATFQREDEFGVFALHAWVWRRNPNGMYAETNPLVTCQS